MGRASRGWGPWLRVRPANQPGKHYMQDKSFEALSRGITNCGEGGGHGVAWRRRSSATLCRERPCERRTERVTKWVGS